MTRDEELIEQLLKDNWFTFSDTPPRIGMTNTDRAKHKPGTGTGSIYGAAGRSMAEVYEIEKVSSGNPNGTPFWRWTERQRD